MRKREIHNGEDILLPISVRSEPFPLISAVA